MDPSPDRARTADGARDGPALGAPAVRATDVEQRRGRVAPREQVRGQGREPPLQLLDPILDGLQRGGREGSRRLVGGDLVARQDYYQQVHSHGQAALATLRETREGLTGKFLVDAYQALSDLARRALREQSAGWGATMVIGGSGYLVYWESSDVALGLLGEIGIDNDLIVDTDEEIYEMNNGCVCCTVRGDLVRVVEGLMRRPGRFDAIVVETTGLADPAPVVALAELADSSVNFVVRPWVKTSDYWAVLWDVTEQVKLQFDANGISIPYPQMDIHQYKAA